MKQIILVNIVNVLGNALFKKYIALLYLYLCASVFFSAGIKANPVEDDIDCWTRLEIEEAFISKQTVQANRDFFSAPEFGWQILVQKKFVSRSNLYGNLYYPGCGSQEAQLRLVERDVLADDHVAIVKLRVDKNIYSFGKHGDRVRFTRHSMHPDANSDADHLPSKALLLRSEHSGTVNFTIGDFTDYLRPLETPVLYLIHCSPGLKVAVRDGQAQFYPGLHRMTRFLMVASRESHVLRMRSGIGGSQLAYHVYAFYGKDRARLARSKTFAMAAKQKKWGHFEYSDLVAALVSYQKGPLRKDCLSILGNSKNNPGTRILCGLALYKIENSDDINYLDGIFKHESLAYQEIVGSAYRSARRKKDREKRNRLKEKNRKSGS